MAKSWKWRSQQLGTSSKEWREKQFAKSIWELEQSINEDIEIKDSISYLDYDYQLQQHGFKNSEEYYSFLVSLEKDIKYMEDILWDKKRKQEEEEDRKRYEEEDYW